MAKEKVYILAKEFKVSSETLVQVLRGMGIIVKSHMSTVDESLREQIKQKFESERALIKKQYARKKKKIALAKEELLAKTKSTTTSPKDKTVAISTEVKKGATTSEPTKKRNYSNAGSNRPQHRRPSTPSQDHKTNPLTSPNSATPTPAKAGSGGHGDTKRPGKKNKKKGKQDRNKRSIISELEMKANVKKTLAKIGAGSVKKRYKKDSSDNETDEHEVKKILNVSEFVTANELANMMNIKASEVIAKCLGIGLFVTINQRLDFETIEMVSDEFGYEAKLMEEYASEDDDFQDEETDLEMVPRAPVITIMGHVDHGKTSLLDYVRKTNVIANEAGGITQHIAAYEVSTKFGHITFLDTPGHEAFTEMRARGSQVTDVVVLVVAADSGVMPQTKEAIDHARAANVPLVIAINKVDLPTANIDRVKSELAQYNVQVDDYGGQISSVEISAKTGAGVDKLLELLALETEILDIKAPVEGKASGVVIESELDKGKGAIATVLIQRGTLRKGDSFVTGIHCGRVRDLFNERARSIEKAGPSQPVIVLGLSGTPQAGDSFRVVSDDKEAREISARRRLAAKERELRKISSVSLEHLYEAMKEGLMQTLNLVIKGDVDGSVEALAASLEKLSTNEIKVNVISKSVGAIKETDIMLATTSNAIIVGFHVNPNTKIREIAKKEGVDIRIYRIIYEAVDEIHNAMEGMLAPEIKEEIVGQVDIRQVFKVSKVGQIAGCMVTSGKITRGDFARLIRDDIEILEGKIHGLKRHKDDVKEVANGFECGIILSNCQEYKLGDRIEVYKKTKVARKLTRKESK